MKAVGFYKAMSIDDDASLEDLELPEPEPLPRDLLVRVAAISVNPVDTKVRKSAVPPAGQARVLGWDAVGTVQARGSQASLFEIGDRVYYAGSITRPGANSEWHVVDERIVAIAPTTLGDADAAAMPLTTLTACELLFDRLGVPRNGGKGQTLLVVGGSGGVGSILIQIARRMTQLTVVATASREETRTWCLELGAHAVIDHSRPLTDELKAAGIGEVDLVASLTQTPRHYAQLVESLKPQGRLGVIDSLSGCDIEQMKTKSLSLHHELMFTRSMFATPDMAEQGKLLAEVGKLIDAGVIRSTARNHFGTINAANLRRAHAQVESGRTVGKLVLAGF